MVCVVRAGELRDAEELAMLHAMIFERPWAGAFWRQEIASPASCLRVTVDETGKLLGFVLARIAADEAEVLSVAIDARARRAGLGTGLLEELTEELTGRGVRRLFLEVAIDNQAARALYERNGFHAVGRRPKYYKREAQAPVDAVILARQLESV